MANEITVNFSLVQEKGSQKTTIQPGSINIDQAAIGGHLPIINSSTAVENIATGDISTPGVCVMRNLDATNFVDFGAGTSTATGTYVKLGKMKAGEIAFFRFGGSVFPMVQADTATCKVQVWLFED